MHWRARGSRTRLNAGPGPIIRYYNEHMRGRRSPLTARRTAPQHVFAQIIWAHQINNLFRSARALSPACAMNCARRACAFRTNSIDKLLVHSLTHTQRPQHAEPVRPRKADWDICENCPAVRSHSSHRCQSTSTHTHTHSQHRGVAHVTGK